MWTETFVYITTIEKKAVIKFREQEGVRKGLGGRKGKLCNYIVISKNII